MSESQYSDEEDGEQRPLTAAHGDRAPAEREISQLLAVSQPAENDEKTHTPPSMPSAVNPAESPNRSVSLLFVALPFATLTQGVLGNLLPRPRVVPPRSHCARAGPVSVWLSSGGGGVLGVMVAVVVVVFVACRTHQVRRLPHSLKKRDLISDAPVRTSFILWRIPPCDDFPWPCSCAW